MFAYTSSLLFLVTPAEFEYLAKMKQVLEMPRIEVTTVIEDFGVNFFAYINHVQCA